MADKLCFSRGGLIRLKLRASDLLSHWIPERSRNFSDDNVMVREVVGPLWNLTVDGFRQPFWIWKFWTNPTIDQKKRTTLLLVYGGVIPMPRENGGIPGTVSGERRDKGESGWCTLHFCPLLRFQTRNCVYIIQISGFLFLFLDWLSNYFWYFQPSFLVYWHLRRV